MRTKAIVWGLKNFNLTLKLLFIFQEGRVEGRKERLNF